MFTSFNRILKFFGLAFGVIFVFFHFHGAVFSTGGLATHEWKILSGQVAAVITDKDYKVKISGNDKPSANDSLRLPDISGYTVDKITAMAPAYRPGKVFIRSMTGLPGAHSLIKKDGRIQRLRLSQMAVDPEAIVIADGNYDLTHLYETVKGLSDGPLPLQKEGNIYLLKMPIIVNAGASLTISGKDTSDLRLSQDDGVFIANSGNLFILRTRIMGWNEKDGGPALFRDEDTFRPYIATWSGSRLYIAGSAISSLGYRKGKSYGLTYSTCDSCLLDNPDLARPTGVMAGNVFSDMYYGFYSYEADGVVIVNNIYANNAIYGIDPHDRSRNLIIAGNETYGSGKKHGIILSRDVTDSWIFNNYSHNNHGSGIMLDRNCRNNVIANNVSAYNAGDGITFFESPDNQTFGNTVYRNNLGGVRIRNSQDITMVDDQITDNGRAPIVIYSKQLKPGDPARNLTIDAYQQKASVTVIGSVFKQADRKPVFKLNDIDSLSLSGIHILSGDKVFTDDLFSTETDIDANADDFRKAVMINQKP